MIKSQEDIGRIEDMLDIWRRKKTIGSMYRCTKDAVVFYHQTKADGTDDFVPTRISLGDILLLTSLSEKTMEGLGLPLDRFLSIRNQSVVYADFLALAGYIKAVTP